MFGSLVKAVAVYWLPLVGYLFFLRFVSLQPTLPVPGFFAADKLLHAGAFSVLGFLWARSVRSLFESPRLLVAVAFWGCFLYGVFDEFLIQATTPGRFPSGWDLLADSVGGILGGVGFRTLTRWPRFSRIMG